MIFQGDILQHRINFYCTWQYKQAYVHFSNWKIHPLLTMQVPKGKSLFYCFQDNSEINTAASHLGTENTFITVLSTVEPSNFPGASRSLSNTINCCVQLQTKHHQKNHQKNYEWHNKNHRTLFIREHSLQTPRAWIYNLHALDFIVSVARLSGRQGTRKGEESLFQKIFYGSFQKA